MARMHYRIGTFEMLSICICVYISRYYGRVGYFSNARGFSVEKSLQDISSNLFLLKRTNQSVVSKGDVDAASMRPALEHGWEANGER